MRKLLRLTESELHRIVENSVVKIIREMGGIYPDGQMDMFFDQHGVDEYRTSVNNQSLEGLMKAEKECFWGHSITRDMGNYIDYICYPKSDYMSKPRQTFMELIKRYVPVADNVNFICERNTTRKAFTVRIKKI